MLYTLFDHSSDRMDRLERENRRLRWFGLGVALLTGFLALGGAQKSDKPTTVEAQHFVLRDKNGIVRGEWGFNERNWPIFRLNDIAGKRRLSCHVADIDDSVSTPAVMLHGKDGVSRITLLVSALDTPLIAIGDKEGKTIVKLPLDLQKK